jgi:hypothetical protein
MGILAKTPHIHHIHHAFLEVSGVNDNFVIIFQDHETCMHDNGVTHSHDISCSVAELKNWLMKNNIKPSQEQQ